MIRTNQTHKNYIGTKPVIAEGIGQTYHRTMVSLGIFISNDIALDGDFVEYGLD